MECTQKLPLPIKIVNNEKKMASPIFRLRAAQSQSGIWNPDR